MCTSPHWEIQSGDKYAPIKSATPLLNFHFQDTRTQFTFVKYLPPLANKSSVLFICHVCSVNLENFMQTGTLPSHTHTYIYAIYLQAT